MSDRLNPLADDLNHVLAHTAAIWDSLKGQRIFITGGTGFFGCWLLESFLWANDALQLGASATVLTRDSDAFRSKAPHLAGHAALRLREGDVRTFDFPDEPFAYVIHAATAASVSLNDQDPVTMFDTIVRGTQRALEFARQCGAERFLLTSSGAVYGPQPPDVSHMSEEYAGAPDSADARASYAEGKRAAEVLCAAYAHRHDVPSTVARCFAFVGPYLPLDRHFAAGNFIADAMRGGPIRVEGDGTPYRSYLYAADLAIWLWTILVRGKVMHPYNVGSDEAVTIDELARVVAQSMTPPVDVAVARRPMPGVPAQRYVPAVGRARSELGLRPTISLPDAIARTISWHAIQGAQPRVAHR